MISTIVCDLLRGYIGADVARLQHFLNEQMGSGLVVDGVYGCLTFDGVTNFQRTNGLAQDGQFGGGTLAKARDIGYVPIEYKLTQENSGIHWPQRPSHPAQPNSSVSEALFGRFDFERTPVLGNPEKIQILGDWVAQNIITIQVPQLRGVVIPIGDAHAVLSDGKLQCHKLARDIILKLFRAWDEAGLTPKILTWYGCWNARLKRGRTKAIASNLSNHAWGSALDINATQNWLGNTPATMGGRGCVREFVEIANDLGVYWGGHYSSRKDGMHFEVAEL